MSDDRNERDASGNLTDWALAMDALCDNGCDCGTDESGACLACVCERAMRTERARAESAESALAEALDSNRGLSADCDIYKRDIDRLRGQRDRLREAVGNLCSMAGELAVRMERLHERDADTGPNDLSSVIATAQAVTAARALLAEVDDGTV